MVRNKLTVIIPTKNDRDDIINCLIALKKQNCDILVVDGYSRDGTDTLAKNAGAKVVYEDTGSRAGAMNVGLRHVKTQYWASTDADCIPPETWVDDIVDALDKSQNDVVSVGGPNYAPKNATFFENCVDVLFFSKMTGSARYGLNKSGVFETDHNPGCNAGYKTKLTKDTYFQEYLPTAEDVVFDYHLREKGYKVLFVSWISMFHHRRKSVKGLFKQLYNYGKGRAIANARYPDLKMATHFIPSLFVLWLIMGATISPVWFPAGAIFSFTLIMYMFGIFMGCNDSTSHYKKPSTIFGAIALTPIAHIAWGLGYIAGYIHEFRKHQQ